MSVLTSFIRSAVWSKRHFEFWQRLGANVTRKHFSSPIPDTGLLARQKHIWNTKSPPSGIDMNELFQLHLLENVFPKYKHELDFAINKTEIPHEFYLNNPGFGLKDASVLHCMIRHFKPRTIIEVGSGNSTLVSARACLINEKEERPAKLIAIEPNPKNYLKNTIPGLTDIIPRNVESIESTFFEQLGNNDILFIDSSHVIRIGNDVNYLYLDVLPILKKGVLVHIHDIFFPYQYPREKVINHQVFWTEQYILQAFLSLNQSYEVIFGNQYMLHRHPDIMKTVFPDPPGCLPHGATCFWIRKIN